uniref:hypothetical protein n=1 Tax=Escherichia coli TaxID=562 RepID=UPI00215B0C07
VLDVPDGDVSVASRFSDAAGVAVAGVAVVAPPSDVVVTADGSIGDGGGSGIGVGAGALAATSVVPVAAASPKPKRDGSWV